MVGIFPLVFVLDDIPFNIMEQVSDHAWREYTKS